MSSKEVLLSIDLSPQQDKQQVCDQIRQALEDGGYKLDDINDTKPWGAYYRVESSQAEKFIAEFFPELNPEEAARGADINPKILMTDPGQRLSWQFHHRRAERWICLAGEAGYHKSMDDDQGELIEFFPGDEVQFECGERHRLVGLLGGRALVAEIWQHTDPDNPSDEDDIIRLADDYQR